MVAVDLPSTGEDRWIGIDFSRFFDNGDSTAPNFTFEVKERSIVIAGTVDGSSDLNDYFVFQCSPGEYNISMTSDSSLYGWSSFRNDTSLEFDILDLIDVITSGRDILQSSRPIKSN
jgi:hypothetical protein